MSDLLIRDAQAELTEWFDSPARKPLLLLGAAQVGKTTLLTHFAREKFRTLVHVSIRELATHEDILANRNPEHLLLWASTKAEAPITDGDTLVIFDDVEHAPAVINTIKTLTVRRPGLDIAMIGSFALLDHLYGYGSSEEHFTQVRVYPLTFPEFLTAIGEAHLAHLITLGNPTDWQEYTHEVESLHRIYLFVGGMPEVVAEFVSNRFLPGVQQVQQKILDSYRTNISTLSTDAAGVQRLHTIWDKVPYQLCQNTRRTIYSRLHHGARGREYARPLGRLAQTGYLTLAPEIRELTFPYTDSIIDNFFRAYLPDVGLLAASIAVDPNDVIVGSRIYDLYNGLLSEQALIQNLLAVTGTTPVYYAADPRPIELFALTANGHNTIFEHKARTRVRSRLLTKAFETVGDSATYLRFSLAPYQVKNNYINVPIWAALNKAHWLGN